MKKSIILRGASLLDDINCHDGEIASPSALPGETLTSGARLALALTDSVPLESDQTFYAVHTLPDGRRNLILRNSSAMLYFIPYDTSDRAPVEMERLTSTIRKIVGVGEWLVILTTNTLYYAKWNGTAYDRLSQPPAAPEPFYSISASALPPYSYAADAKPTLNVRVTVGQDHGADSLDWLAGRPNTLPQAVREAIMDGVSDSLRGFVESARSAGLNLSPVRIAAARVTADGTLWQMSQPVMVGDATTPFLTIRDTEHHDGVLYLTLVSSVSPYRVTSLMPDASTKLLVASHKKGLDPNTLSSPIWISATERGFQSVPFPTGENDFETFPVALTDMRSGGVPTDIFSIGGLLFAVRNDTPFTRLLVSSNSDPMVAMSESTVEGEGIQYITRHLSGTTTAGDEGFPLVAFCGDGIRILKSTGSGYRSVRLLSREVAHSRYAFAPIPSGTVFLTQSGLKKLEGTTVKTVSESGAIPYDETARLFYLYDRDSVGIYTSKDAPGGLVGLKSGTVSELVNTPEQIHYGWPYCFGKLGTAIGKINVTDDMEQDTSLDTEPGSDNELVPIKTRPIKLGDPFAIKKVEEIEAIWPDGCGRALKLYGALRPGRWFFLGLAPRGRMRMRGSGWRFFRVETFAVKSGSSTLLPTLNFIYS